MLSVPKLGLQVTGFFRFRLFRAIFYRSAPFFFALNGRESTPGVKERRRTSGRGESEAKRAKRVWTVFLSTKATNSDHTITSTM